MNSSRVQLQNSFLPNSFRTLVTGIRLFAFSTPVCKCSSEFSVAYPFCLQFQAQCSRWFCLKCPCEACRPKFFEPSLLRRHIRWDHNSIICLPLWIPLVCSFKTVSSQTPLGHLSQAFDLLPSADPFANVQVNYQLLIHSVSNFRPSAINGCVSSALVKPADWSSLSHLLWRHIRWAITQ